MSCFRELENINIDVKDLKADITLPKDDVLSDITVSLCGPIPPGSKDIQFLYLRMVLDYCCGYNVIGVDKALSCFLLCKRKYYDLYTPFDISSKELKNSLDKIKIIKLPPGEFGVNDFGTGCLLTGSGTRGKLQASIERYCRTTGSNLDQLAAYSLSWQDFLNLVRAYFLFIISLRMKQSDSLIRGLSQKFVKTVGRILKDDKLENSGIDMYTGNAKLVCYIQSQTELIAGITLAAMKYRLKGRNNQESSPWLNLATLRFKNSGLGLEALSETVANAYHLDPIMFLKMVGNIGDSKLTKTVTKLLNLKLFEKENPGVLDITAGGLSIIMGVGFNQNPEFSYFCQLTLEELGQTLTGFKLTSIESFEASDNIKAIHYKNVVKTFKHQLDVISTAEQGLTDKLKILKMTSIKYEGEYKQAIDNATNEYARKELADIVNRLTETKSLRPEDLITDFKPTVEGPPQAGFETSSEEDNQSDDNTLFVPKFGISKVGSTNPTVPKMKQNQTSQNKPKVTFDPLADTYVI